MAPYFQPKAVSASTSSALMTQRQCSSDPSRSNAARELEAGSPAGTSQGTPNLLRRVLTATPSTVEDARASFSEETGWNSQRELHIGRLSHISQDSSPACAYVARRGVVTLNEYLLHFFRGYAASGHAKSGTHIDTRIRTDGQHPDRCSHLRCGNHFRSPEQPQPCSS